MTTQQATTPLKSPVNTSVPEPKYSSNNPRPLPDQDTLHKLFKYEAGVLYWKGHVYDWHNGREAGCTHSTGYVHIWIMGIGYKRSRLVYQMHHGERPDQIDHINRIRDDDRIENLRSVNAYENANNMCTNNGIHSGHPGVLRSYEHHPWRVTIGRNGTERHICKTHDLQKAIAARKHYEYQMDVKGLTFEQVPVL